MRTKVNLDVKNNRKSHPRTHREESVVKEVLKSTRDHLTHAGQTSAEVFLIDSYDRDKYDFTLLAEKLLYQLPVSKLTAKSLRTRSLSTGLRKN